MDWNASVTPRGQSTKVATHEELAMAFEEARGKSSVLSFIAGYVDTAVFIGLFGLFTAHVTGNFVLIGSQLVHRTGEVWPKLLAFPAFILGVAATVKIAEARS